MNRRKFVKALAALPAVVGGLISIPKGAVASPVRVAHPVDDAGISPSTPFREEVPSVDPFDDWLDFVGQGQYAGGVEPVRFKVGVDLAGKDGRDLTIYLDSREIEFHREAVVGRISEPKLLTGSGRDVEVSIGMKIDGEDRVSEVLQQWATDAEEAARRCQESIESMVFQSIVPDDRRQVVIHRSARPYPWDQVVRTSKPARLA